MFQLFFCMSLKITECTALHLQLQNYDFIYRYCRYLHGNLLNYTLAWWGQGEREQEKGRKKGHPAKPTPPPDFPQNTILVYLDVPFFPASQPAKVLLGRSPQYNLHLLSSFQQQQALSQSF